MNTDRGQLRADLPSIDGRPRVLSVPDAELMAGTMLRDGDVVIEVPSVGSRRCLLGWCLLSLVLGGRSPSWLWAGGLGLFLSGYWDVLPCDASSHEAPSPDSSEARAIRSRLGRGRRSRSRSRSGPRPGFTFFPVDARRAFVHPPVPLHMWHPEPRCRAVVSPTQKTDQVRSQSAPYVHLPVLVLANNCRLGPAGTNSLMPAMHTVVCGPSP